MMQEETNISTCTSNQDLEAELFDLLNSPDPIAGISTASTTNNLKTAAEESVAGKVSVNTASLDDTQDFLSWLEDSPTKKKNDDNFFPSINNDRDSTINVSGAAEAVGDLLGVMDPQSPAAQKDSHLTADDLKKRDVSTNNDQLVDDSVDHIVSSKHLSEEFPSNIQVPVQQTMDTFFDEVFGNEATHQSLNSEIPLKSFVDEVKEVVVSPFPDLGKLRQLVDRGGYIPTEVRAQVLLLLLTGNCLVDEEAQSFHVSQVERDFYSELVSDCRNLVQSTSPDNSGTNASTVDDMIAIITLFCQRKSVDYKSVFCRSLLSIYGSSMYMQKSLASSCFSALVSNFSPLVGLQVRILQRATLLNTY